MLLSTPVHSIATWGWTTSVSSTILASCFDSKFPVTFSWKSAPSSLATARRSGTRSNVNGTEMGENMAPKEPVRSPLSNYSCKGCLPVMMTWDAPSALATIKHTNPMGPERAEKREGCCRSAARPKSPFLSRFHKRLRSHFGSCFYFAPSIVLWLSFTCTTD